MKRALIQVRHIVAIHKYMTVLKNFRYLQPRQASFNNRNLLPYLLIFLCNAAPLQVAVEFARHGCLRDFLRRNRPHTIDDDDMLDDVLEVTTDDVDLTTDLLISFAFQTARGMEFLSSRKVNTSTNSATLLISYL